MNLTKVILFYATISFFVFLLVIVFSPQHPLSVNIFGMFTDMRWFGYSLFGRDSFSVLRLTLVALVLVIMTKAWRGH